MPDGRPRRAVRFAKRSAVVVAIIAVLSAAAFFPFAGRFLAVNDSLERADAIFALAGARVERWMEAADLYREGWAPRIVLSPGRDEAAAKRLRQMGIRFPSEPELVREALIQLKVPADSIIVLPHDVDNTAQEAAAIRALVARERWKGLIVVTSPYHARRARLAFRREFEHTDVKVIVRSTRHGAWIPDRWWTRRSDLRFVLSELQKLVLYRLGLRG
jgi:uncharacterized SAM-binding protein YcdF (DUF218 family)